MDTLIERSKSVLLPGGFMEVREYYSYWYSFFILYFRDTGFLHDH